MIKFCLCFTFGKKWIKKCILTWKANVIVDFLPHSADVWHLKHQERRKQTLLPHKIMEMEKNKGRWYNTAVMVKQGEKPWNWIWSGIIKTKKSLIWTWFGEGLWSVLKVLVFFILLFCRVFDLDLVCGFCVLMFWYVSWFSISYVWEMFPTFSWMNKFLLS